jgi:hypothetical protein
MGDVCQTIKGVENGNAQCEMRNAQKKLKKLVKKKKKVKRYN